MFPDARPDPTCRHRSAFACIALGVLPLATRVSMAHKSARRAIEVSGIPAAQLRRR